MILKKMKSILLVYKTQTGFTKKYAEWISEEIDCTIIPFEKMETTDINKYNIIIYGGAMHAGQIQGLKKFKKKIAYAFDRKIVVFATGAAPYSEEGVGKIKEDNFSENEKKDIAFFYFESGMNMREWESSIKHL